MPTSLSSRLPSYRRHKPTGQAVVTINGRDIYLGKWNTAASKAEYDRLIAEFLANGRRLRSEIESTVVDVINAYRKFAERHYQKNGGGTCEYGCITGALKVVRELYGRTNANQFGPLALKAVRQRMAVRIEKSVHFVRLTAWDVGKTILPQNSRSFPRSTSRQHDRCCGSWRSGWTRPKGERLKSCFR